MEGASLSVNFILTTGGLKIAPLLGTIKAEVMTMTTAVQDKILEAFKVAYPNSYCMGRNLEPDRAPYVLWAAPKIGGGVWLKLHEDGSSQIEVLWGPEIYYDKWEVDPKGVIRYFGSMDEHRDAPEWLINAL